MTLPLDKISFSKINTELSRSSSARFDIDDAEGRKLASAGNTGQSLTTKTPVKLSNFRGHARKTITLTATPVQNIFVYDGINGTGYVPGLTYATYIVASSVLVGSVSTSLPSMTIDRFTSGDVLEIENRGEIIGAGGNGGGGGGRDSQGGAGSSGGTAILASSTALITNNGTIYGGGGGGGGGYGDHATGFFSDTTLVGGAGGGGAGYIAGSPGGTRTSGGTGGGGQAKADTVGSGGGWSGNGGNGGAPGQPGIYGTGVGNYDNSIPPQINSPTGGGTPGAAGYYVDGIARVTLLGSGIYAGSVR